MSSKCIDLLYVIKSTIVNDCFVICVGLSLLSKTVDMTTQRQNKPIGKYAVRLDLATGKARLQSMEALGSTEEERGKLLIDHPL